MDTITGTKEETVAVTTGTPHPVNLDTIYLTWIPLPNMGHQVNKMVSCVPDVGRVITATLQHLLAMKKPVPTRKLALASTTNATVVNPITLVAQSLSTIDHHLVQLDPMDLVLSTMQARR